MAREVRTDDDYMELNEQDQLPEIQTRRKIKKYKTVRRQMLAYQITVLAAMAGGSVGGSLLFTSEYKNKLLGLGLILAAELVGVIILRLTHKTSKDAQRVIDDLRQRDLQRQLVVRAESPA